MSGVEAMLGMTISYRVREPQVLRLRRNRAAALRMTIFRRVWAALGMTISYRVREPVGMTIS